MRRVADGKARRISLQALVRVIGMWLALGWLLPGAAHAAAPATVPMATLAAQLGAAAAAARGCAGDSAACTRPGLPQKERVEGGPNGPFVVSWDWLGDALAGAKPAPAPQRLRAMQAVDMHLRTLAAQSGLVGGAAGASVHGDDFARARSAASAALSRPEFQTSEGPNWFQRKMAKLQDWIFSLFNGMDRLGRKAPWLAPLIEWSCFGLATAGLLWFVWRNLQRQALRISLTEGATLQGVGGLDTSNWERLAADQAAAGDWREAVHSLYWAGIAHLEGRRAWRPNVARTPREYLRLLRPGTEAQRALRELTRSLERLWYGFQEADEAQYRAAQLSLQALQAARAERAAGAEESVAAGTTLSPASGGA